MQPCTRLASVHKRNSENKAKRFLKLQSLGNYTAARLNAMTKLKFSLFSKFLQRTITFAYTFELRFDRLYKCT